MLNKILNTSTAILSVLLFTTLTVTGQQLMAQEKSTTEWRVSPRKAKIANPVTVDQSSIAIGKKLYQQECVECHGKSGKGDGPEAGELDKPVVDFSVTDVWKQSDGALFWKIKAGRRPMPSFKALLSANEIWQIINFMRNKFDVRDAK